MRKQCQWKKQARICSVREAGVSGWWFLYIFFLWFLRVIFSMVKCSWSSNIGRSMPKLFFKTKQAPIGIKLARFTVYDMFSSESPRNTCLVNQRVLLGVVMYQNPSISPSEGLWNKTSKKMWMHIYLFIYSFIYLFIYVYYIHSSRAMHWCRCLDHGRICHDSVKLRKLGWMNPQSLVSNCAK